MSVKIWRALICSEVGLSVKQSISCDKASLCNHGNMHDAILRDDSVVDTVGIDRATNISV